MATFPTGIFSPTSPTSSDKMNVVPHAAQHAAVNAEIVAIETALGANMSNVLNATLDTDVALTANSDAKVASQKATKAYADAIIAGVPYGRVLSDGTVNPTNLLTNGDFESWSAGASVAPDGWTAPSITVAREGTIKLSGSYSMKLTGTNDSAYQDVITERGAAYWRGRKVTFGCWVYGATGESKLQIYDGTSSVSATKTTNNAWEWLTVTHTVDASATYLRINCNVVGTTKTAYFDGAICVEGASAFAFSKAPADVVQETAHTKDGTISPTNLISNGDFESWSAGASAAPDGWTLTGASAAVAREGTIIKLGTYSAKLTRSGTDLVMSKTGQLHPEKGIAYWKGRTLTFSCWVYATVAGRARIYIDDSVATTYSSYHTGDSTWQLLTVSRIVDSSASALQTAVVVDTGDTSAYFDGAICVEGSSAFAFSPKPLDASAQIVAETDESKFSHKLPVVINGTTYYIMMTTT